MSVVFSLQLKARPTLRLDLSGILPSSDDLARRPVWHGNEMLSLGEFFSVAPLAGDAPALVFEGDLSRCDNIGRGMDGGAIRVEGNAGDYLGAEMRSGDITVTGDAGLLAACEMAGGRLEVAGSVGDFAASALPGDMDGMRGGLLVIGGNAGARCGDRMRRGTVLIGGDAGDFLASRLVAGTIALAGTAGAHCGYGMRRGTLVFAGPAPEAPATFASTGHDIATFWALLARSLARHGGAFAGLPARRPRRWVGDLAADGRGEWLIPD